MSPRPLTQIKHFTDGLVVRWVTTSESPLLYVFVLFFFLAFIFCVHFLRIFRSGSETQNLSFSYLFLFARCLREIFILLSEFLFLAQFAALRIRKRNDFMKLNFSD
jgi:hypothetical protein